MMSVFIGPCRDEQYLYHKGWLATSAVIAAAIAITSVVVYYIQVIPSPPSVTRHIFKVKEMYPTKPGGREWFINMDNLTRDGIFDPGSPIRKQADGSWQIEGRHANDRFGNEVRMDVNTPSAQEPWKNVEITGYAKVISADSTDSHLDWYARGGKHTSSSRCEGVAYHAGLKVDGSVFWQKEIWHTGGYTDSRSLANAIHPILERWIGWKVVMYNVDNYKAVKMESYLDDQDNNPWKKITDLIDNGDGLLEAQTKNSIVLAVQNLKII